jgi:hypothetical protein
VSLHDGLGLAEHKYPDCLEAGFVVIDGHEQGGALWALCDVLFT